MDFNDPSCIHCGSEFVTRFTAFFILLALPLIIIFVGRSMRKVARLRQMGVAVQSLGIFGLLVTTVLIIVFVFIVP